MEPALEHVFSNLRLTVIR